MCRPYPCLSHQRWGNCSSCLQDELETANNELTRLREANKVLREECKYGRQLLCREDHPDKDAPPTCPFYTLNTQASQADDCNYHDARRATDDAGAMEETR